MDCLLTLYANHLNSGWLILPTIWGLAGGREFKLLGTKLTWQASNILNYLSQTLLIEGYNQKDRVKKRDVTDFQFFQMGTCSEFFLN